jgi:hypothetical protein
MDSRQSADGEVSRTGSPSGPVSGTAPGEIMFFAVPPNTPQVAIDPNASSKMTPAQVFQIVDVRIGCFTFDPISRIVA